MYRGSGTLAFAQRLNRTPCPPVSAGTGWGSTLDSAWLWYAGGGADSLYWTLGDGTTASSNGSDTLHHRYSANGTYTVWQFAYRNCGSADSTSTNVVIQGIGLIEGSQPKSYVVPTRSVGPLVLQAAAPMDAVCWDALGRRVASVREWVPNTVWNPFTTCPNGVYYIELADGQRWPVVLQRD
ncbi:MAG: PKD domain-containing protein [Schleiferiaceae bacterium]